MSEWISVKTKLPEDERDVLLFTSLGVRLGWRKSAPDENPAWRPLGDFDHCTVTHWQPLPAPPEAQ